ncbi:ANTAR domain-containing protein [Mycobacterium sp. 236(2023)]|uniref:ANTAR domain-containing protein n=1 Tax=Mycobacterium sp. 236(2023) TaxID=3038163 RepID=UPI002415035C|nr:ANTAR domain-containing protein [Mycobacterium sp. 236(2023)]MDG4667600.1 ANTAR domain-containing protein [Mycobacterium sp. 236(2023)]
MSFRTADDTSRQIIDIATGILIGLRGCSRAEAFEEMVRVMRETGIGLSTIASGLVAVASGSASAEHVEAFTVWGELIGNARPAPLIPAS